MPKVTSKNTLIYNIISISLIVLLIVSIWLCYNNTSSLFSNAAELNNLNNNIQNVQDEFNFLNAQIDSNEYELSIILNKINLLNAEKRYNLHDPTYSEVLTFLAKDKTDQNEYVIGEYTCVYFSRDVCNNALKQGIRCAYVSLDFADTTFTGHAIVAFNTTDKGLVYFEPQSDDRAYISIGERYWQNVATKPGYSWKAPDYDDTIVEINHYW
ncbi:MAG: hypothetical protein MUO82_08460 [Candidatus Thermoplasmatota archaeon]|nr:hypothetical protein [Candidatus Thermoplasmatota archaeon]